MTLQRTLGNRAVQRLLAQRQQETAAPQTVLHAPDNLLQAKKVLTMGGEWEDVTYAEYNDVVGGKTPVRGVDMRLEFHPNASVDAEKIGLTQSITSLEGNQPSQAGDDFDKFRQQQEIQIQNGPHQGSMIDRGGHKENNPIYGSDVNQTGDLKETSFANQEPGFSQLGRRVPGEAPVKAVLTDTPRRRAPLPPDSRQEFETTAVAVKGVQEGTYYGSVQWGWETDSAGTFSMIDFAVKEFGNPTARFKASAQKWNQGHYGVRRGLKQNSTGQYALTTWVDQTQQNVPLPLPGAPGTETLLPLPPKAAFKNMKAAATKKKTPLSGQLSTKNYGKLELKFDDAVNNQKWQEAKNVVDQLKGRLDEMNNKDDKYWVSSVLKETHFVPIYNAVKALSKALEIKIAQLVNI